MSVSEEEQFHFPQYRKYKNAKSFFKISSLTSFQEIKSMPGGIFKAFNFEVKILPERNFLMDMLLDYKESWELIGEEEYEHVFRQIVS